MRKEQIVDMIGEAPDHYVKDAKESAKKRRIPNRFKWIGSIAAALVVVILLTGMLKFSLPITAKAVSVASEPRIKSYSETPDEEKDEWRASRDLRKELLSSTLPSLSDFAEQCSAQMISGTDSTNRVWSPINAYIALSLTAELAEGEAQEELFELLGVDSTEKLRSRISAVWESAYDHDRGICTLANSLWLDHDLSYVQEKMDVLAHDYYASVYLGDLGSERINRDITNWIKNQTGGILSDRAENSKHTTEDTMLIIASTVYFQANWSEKFDASMNTNDIFHAESGDVDCTYMNQKLAELTYYWIDDYGAVAMRMKNGASMWFILPDEDKTVDDVLTGGDYMNMVTQSEDFPEENSKRMKVNLTVPKFDVSSSVNVKESLENLGITKIFDPTVNSFASSLQSQKSDYPVYLNSIHQDTRVKIDEDGVTAASYIEISFGAGGAEPPDEIIDFVLDRPFVFVVTREQIPLFVGTVNMP